jgi:hypothetical protein
MKEWLEPDEKNPGVKFVCGRCKECGRPGEVIWAKNSALKIATIKPLISVNLEGVQGARGTWLVSEDVANRLKKAWLPLTGMVLQTIWWHGADAFADR